MRRAGQNPTDIEVLDIINKIDDESGYLDFQVIDKFFALRSNILWRKFRYLHFHKKLSNFPMHCGTNKQKY